MPETERGTTAIPEREPIANIVLNSFEATAMKATAISEIAVQKLSTVSLPSPQPETPEVKPMREYPILFDQLRNAEEKINEALIKIEDILKRCEL